MSKTKYKLFFCVCVWILGASIEWTSCVQTDPIYVDTKRTENSGIGKKQMPLYKIHSFLLLFFVFLYFLRLAK